MAITSYAALLRAVNVGGTGKLPMTELAAMCLDAGLADVKTYIASGNVVFTSKLSEAAVKAALAKRLEKYAGKSVGVLVRTAAELAAVVAANPFAGEAPNRTLAIFLDDAPAKSALREVSGQAEEKLVLGRREIYVWYGDGMASSRLKITAAAAGTGRNMNTVAKLAAMTAALAGR